MGGLVMPSGRESSMMVMCGVEWGVTVCSCPVTTCYWQEISLSTENCVLQSVRSQVSDVAGTERAGQGTSCRTCQSCHGWLRPARPAQVLQPPGHCQSSGPAQSWSAPLTNIPGVTVLIYQESQSWLPEVTVLIYQESQFKKKSLLQSLGSFILDIAF